MVLGKTGTSNVLLCYFWSQTRSKFESLDSARLSAMHTTQEGCEIFWPKLVCYTPPPPYLRYTAWGTIFSLLCVGGGQCATHCMGICSFGALRISHT